MFLDYYEILEIDVDASVQDIKKAFKNQAVKWHPDRNSNYDTTERMQMINEAYLILKDAEARKLYDIEYWEYKRFVTVLVQQQNSTGVGQRSYSENRNIYNKSELKNTSNNDYEIINKLLEKWILNARRQAVKLALQTIRDFRGIASSGIKATAEKSLSGIVSYIFLSFIFLIIISLSKSCN
jgi:curved DNA-binding protein CbpA